MKASCLCGKVQIKIGRFTGPYELCHCNRCRKHTGSAFNSVLDSTVDDYEILSGEENIVSFKAPLIDSQPNYQVWFCNTCGSPLPDPDPAGDIVEIPAGIIDGEIEITPDKSVFIEQSFSWIKQLAKLQGFTKPEIVEFRRKYGRARPGKADQQ